MSATILIVDDEEHARYNISSYLAPLGYEILEAATLTKAREYIHRGDADIILLDVLLPDGYGPSLLDELALQPTRPPIILITAHGDIDMAVEAMKNGAHDFLTKPIKLAELEKSIQRGMELVAMRRELAHLRQSRNQDFIVGDSPDMKQMVEMAHRAAEASVSVLITGETGTGKEVIAKAISQMGPRAKKPFIPINCAAIQSTMLESELFGHEAGSFTGADKRKPGLMEVADTGILFLDEISSMQMDMQAKLLRALEDHSFRRVGGNTYIKVDVQILAASNRDLLALIRENKFREDLYYRLKVVDIEVPSLRQHKEDIPELVGLFMRKANQNMGKNVTNISLKAMQALLAHNWPGNIRELRHVIDRAVLCCDGDMIDLPQLPKELLKAGD
jgi:two-component system, NtrC family, response regulator AtoC